MEVLVMDVPSTAESVNLIYRVINQLVNVMHVQLDIKDLLALKVSIFFVVQFDVAVKPVLSSHSKEDQKWFSRQLIATFVIADQTYCRMPQREHSVIISTCIKLIYVFKTFVLSTFERTLKICLTVCIFVDRKQPLYLYLLETANVVLQTYLI